MSHSGTDFRPDVEGLRGLAVLLVVLFHAGLATPGGFIGVDVFFVISGFLISGLLLRELGTSGRVDLARFYARRVRRLLPAGAVVLVVTLVAAWFLVDPLDRAAAELDGAAAALSIANIRFAIAAGDYFQSVADPSPFVHFWSLGVEEQFYLVWPALLILAGRVVRGRAGAIAVLGIVFAASLTAELLITSSQVNVAFYSLPTRAFELATGGLVAVASMSFGHLPRLVTFPAGILGIGAILAAGLVFDETLAYPGLYALVPTIGTAALIIAGPRALSGRLLSVPQLRWLGRISYSLYLWHWPILVLVPLAIGAPLSVPETLGCVAAALVVAALSWRLVEEPFRRGFGPITTRPRRTVLAGLTAVLALAVASGSLAARSTAQLDGYGTTAAPSVEQASSGTGSASTSEPLASLPAAVSWSPPSATASLRPTPKPTARPTPTPVPAPIVQIAYRALPGDVRPSLAEARGDREVLWADGCLGFEPATLPPTGCVFGRPSGSFTIALVGDSHASALFPAVNWVARQHGARLLPFVKVACPFIAMRIVDPIIKREYTECAAWNSAVVSRLATIRPDLTIVTMSHWIYPLSASDSSATSIGLAVGREIDRVPGRVVLLVDTPHADVDVPACLSAHVADVSACSTPRAIALSGHGTIERIAATEAGVPTIDLAPATCPGSPCPAVLDGMIVFRDSHHLTATFAVALGPVLDRAVRPYL
jgi:peptidoglycan/LPS O-acetylase OafA/YrhL